MGTRRSVAALGLGTQAVARTISDGFVLDTAMRSTESGLRFDRAAAPPILSLTALSAFSTDSELLLLDEDAKRRRRRASARIAARAPRTCGPPI